MQTTNVSSTWGARSSASAVASPDGLRRPTHTPEQLLFLHRFEVLLNKRRQHVGRLPPTDWRIRLIDKALYSTYQDCLALSVGDEARERLRRERGASSG